MGGVPPWVLFLLAAHLVGFITSIVALMETRTAEGTVAWLLSLNTVPWIAIPAWWLFGRSRLSGYVTARRGGDARLRDTLDLPSPELLAFRPNGVSTDRGVLVVEELARMPVLRGNAIEVLVDGEATYENLFAGIAEARHTLLVQFYIVRNDRAGARLRDALIAKAREGVRVYFLYDGAGCYGLPDAWFEALEDAGVEVNGFALRRGLTRRAHVNFRNHRKLVVVDGRLGWVGGFNIGEEYLGRDPEFGDWRDVHLWIEGPAVLGLKLSFVEDWYWTSGEIPQFDWTPCEATDGSDVPVLLIPSGPADPRETASLFFQHVIHSATRRIWIATPYFVPDQAVMAAFQLARLKGVDVRILVARRPDSLPVHLASFTYFQPLLEAGVRIFRYDAGFLHSKIFVADDRISGVGTLNLDNRSLRLNFEITALLMGSWAASEVEAVFERDFEQSTEMAPQDLEGHSLGFRVACRAARLLSPIL